METPDISTVLTSSSGNGNTYYINFNADTSTKPGCQEHKSPCCNRDCIRYRTTDTDLSKTYKSNKSSKKDKKADYEMMLERTILNEYDSGDDVYAKVVSSDPSRFGGKEDAVQIKLSESILQSLFSKRKKTFQSISSIGGHNVTTSVNINLNSAVSGLDQPTAPQTLGVESEEEIIPPNVPIFCQGRLEIWKGVQSEEYALCNDPEGRFSGCQYGTKDAVVLKTSNEAKQANLFGNMFLVVGCSIWISNLVINWRS